MTLSLTIITKDVFCVIERAKESTDGLWSELLVDDEGSTDGTIEIIKKHGGKVFTSHGKTLGQRKQGLIDRAKGDWILVLDADEMVSEELREEIRGIVSERLPRRYTPRNDPSTASFGKLRTALRVNGYRIPYQNHVFGKPVYFGGENYSKVRLFRRGKGRVSPNALHEEVAVEGKIGRLAGKIMHHSYRTPVQLFTKFTTYAWMASRERRKVGEQVTLKKLFLYGPHMFWARFIQDQGYRDGFHGFVLAFAFAYMETLTYWFMFVKHG